MADDIPPIDKAAPVASTTLMEKTSFEWLCYGISQNAIAQNLKASKNELQELKAEQDKVRSMQQLQQAIGVLDEDESSISITNELKNSLELAKEYGANIPTYQDNVITYSQRIDLQDRLRIAIENKNQDNELRLQGISRITNVLHEMYALMRMIMRTGHEMTKSVIRRFKDN